MNSEFMPMHQIESILRILAASENPLLVHRRLSAKPVRTPSEHVLDPFLSTSYYRYVSTGGQTGTTEVPVLKKNSIESYDRKSPEV
jgi:hypothetical protein